MVRWGKCEEKEESDEESDGEEGPLGMSLRSGALSRSSTGCESVGEMAESSRGGDDVADCEAGRGRVNWRVEAKVGRPRRGGTMDKNIADVDVPDEGRNTRARGGKRKIL